MIRRQRAAGKRLPANRGPVVRCWFHNGPLVHDDEQFGTSLQHKRLRQRRRKIRQREPEKMEIGGKPRVCEMRSAKQRQTEEIESAYFP